MKDIILAQIIKLTRAPFSPDANALFISKAIQASRNVVSQYLNEWFNNGRFIKVNTRPVLFYDIAETEKICGQKLDTYEFKSFDALRTALQKKAPQDFEKLIGYNESLHHVVSKCKAGVSYPPNGLPVLLYGPPGTGKSFIAQLMYEYAVNHEIIEAKKKCITLNCSEYANNPELLTANLFGHKKGAYTGAVKDNLGLLKAAEGGVLFLDEIHCLKAECQEKLFLFMDKGIYHLLGENENWYRADVRLIFATTENPEKCLLKTLLRRIPITVTVPSLEERGIHERVQLIYHLLQTEELRIQKNIQISNVAYNMLLRTNFSGNIGELKNALQASCANAFLKMTPAENFLAVHVYDMPENFMKMMPEKHQMLQAQKQNDMIKVVNLKKFFPSKRAQIRLNDEILQQYRILASNKIEISEFYEKIDRALIEYYDHIIFEKRAIHNTKNEFIQNIVQNIFEIISIRYGFKISNNDIIAISNYINDYTNNNYELWNYFNQYQKEARDLQQFVYENLNREYLIAKEISGNIKNSMDMELDMLFISILALNLKKIHKIVDINKRIGVIIAHGYSTASSIADSANKLLGQYVFDAIDMPLNVTTQTVVDSLNAYLNRIGNIEELILLVDMGSLEEIYTGIERKNLNIGIMNLVTTKMAVAIGGEMIRKIPLNEIFQHVCDYKIRYQIIENKIKEPVILCACASGIGTAEKLRKILLSSLPRQIPIRIVQYDYASLLEKKSTDAFFDTYRVLCLIGTLNPQLDNIPFIPIEQLIAGESANILDYWLREYLNEEELNCFRKNIIKKFSLSNIISNLTILNPDKLLKQVANAIDNLQNLLQIQLSNNTCYGLYVHSCCMIERLVITKQQSDTAEYGDTVFAGMVKKAFSVVEKYYRVEIPLEEMHYLEEYIKNDRKI